MPILARNKPQKDTLKLLNLNKFKGIMTVGFKCLVLLDEEGKPKKTYSIAAGLDYPGIGPEHNHLKVTGRAEYATVTNEEVLEAFQELSRTEGIIPALESAHAVAIREEAGTDNGSRSDHYR